ncbi:MAG: formate dehydrogenase accessory protein FdhE [Smithellaceae bacterium]
MISKPSVMDEIIERAIEQNPQSSELLKSFGPVIAKQRQLTAAIKLTKLDYAVIDQEKLKAGVPVSQQINLFSPDDPFTEIALSLSEAVQEGMPSLKEGFDRLSNLIAKGKLRLADYFAASPGDKKTTDYWIKDLQVSPSNTSFLISLLARVILERRAGEIIAALGEFVWEKGYCPVCGEFPSIALIEEEGGKRFLHCSSCGHAWGFTRVVCPYCETEASKGMDYFYVENKTQESAFVCEKCRKYLVTLYRAGSLHERDMEISAISLVHLDMIMQGKGYEPMTSCAWNVLS